MNARLRPEENLRVPPHSLDSECAVLGGLMNKPTALAEISDWLSESDFYRKDHRLIYRAIVELASKGKPQDAVTLGDWFEAQGLGELVGGMGYVMKLANTTGSAANIAAYAEIVREKARLRELIDAGAAVASEAWAPRADASLIAAHASQRIGALVGDPRAGGLHALKGTVGTWFAALNDRFQRKEALTGIETPWAKLNELTLGLQPGDLTIVAARTSMGKSVLAFQLAAHNGLAGRHTAVFSLEMRADQFLQRAVAAFGEIPHEHLRSPVKMAEQDWPKVTAMTIKLGAAPLVIDDQPGLTAQQIVARLKRQHMRSPVTLAIVDHLHEIKRPGRDPVNEFGDAVRTLRSAGKELGIPIVLLAQLNRSNVSRADHRPTTADLRASGSIEEIADVILLIHREDAYDRNTHMKGVVELILGKGRDFPVGEVVYLKNMYSHMRLDDWEGPLPTKPAAGAGKATAKSAHPDEGEDGAKKPEKYAGRRGE